MPSKPRTSANKPAAKPAAKPESAAPAEAPATLAQKASATTAARRKPVFRDVPGIPRVPLADGRVGCVQAEVILAADGGLESGPHMLTVPRKNADGSESGARYSLADLQLIADAYAAAGIKLV